MTRRCKHCASPYSESSGVNGFCCSGCQQVYALIQGEGLSEYYRLQDRAGQPLKDRSLAAPDVAVLQQAQGSVEIEGKFGQAKFEVEGMSCMGCAWLVERLASDQNGLIQVSASLSEHTVSLEWHSGEFDLSMLGAELFKFGYRLRSTPKSPNQTPRLSPLALRALLSLVFTGNALLLAVYQQYAIASDQGVILLHLLSLICLIFTLLLGGAPFFTAVYRAWKIRRWHSDSLPVAMIIAAFLFIFYAVALGYWSLSVGAFGLTLWLSLWISARWLASKFVAKKGKVFRMLT